MALQKPSPDLLPAENYARYRAAFEAIDAATAAIAAAAVSIGNEAQARASAILAEAQARVEAIAQEAQVRADTADALYRAIAVEAQARADTASGLYDAIADEAGYRDEAVRALYPAFSQGDEALSQRIEQVRSLLSEVRADLEDSFLSGLIAIVSGSRPGLCPAAFSASALGPITASQPLDPADVVTTPFGPAYRLNGAAYLAPRASVPTDRDTIWVVKARYWRLIDVLDPNNSAVDLGIQWLDLTGGDAGRTLLRRETNLRVQDGPRTASFRVPALDGDPLAIQPPPGAASWRVYLRAWGGGAVAIGELGPHETTFAGVYAPDVTALAARLGTIEGQLAAGLPLTAPRLPSYAVADLPQPGNPGRQAWASDGRARSADGTLEAANAGTGVSVEDNGTTWVIPGTNQQVQV